MKLADALLRRKELNLKVAQLHQIHSNLLQETVVDRRKAHEGIDDIVARVSKLDAAQVTAEYDYYASALRRCDAAIQQLNWTTDIELDDSVMSPYKAQA